MKDPAKPPPEPPGDAPVVLRTWVWGAGVRCMLSAVESGFEFLVIRDGTVIRRQRYANVRRALEAAKEWRVDYEMERSRRVDHAAARLRCPECGDEVSTEARPDDGSWLSCQECGHVWRLSAEATDPSVDGW